MQRLSVIVGIVVVLASGLITACQEGPPATTPPSTTTGLPAIALGCYDGGGNDLQLVAPIDTSANARLHSTLDGTCSTPPAAVRTVVQSATQSGAAAKCIGLGFTAATANPLTSNGYAGLPYVYECF